MSSKKNSAVVILAEASKSALVTASKMQLTAALTVTLAAFVMNKQQKFGSIN